ncbi:MAG: hypothetical protein ACM359_06245 [Bacillota bacterium]
MTRHFATALLIGVGFVPDRPVGVDGSMFRREDAPQAMQRVVPSTRIRRAAFDYLKSAGRYRREQIASIAYEDGRLWAEWAGHVDAREPRRIETAELDAEWMAHAPPGRDGEAWWLVARRDLQPTAEGEFWSVMVYGQTRNPGSLQVIATADRPPAVRGGGTYSAHFVQGPESVRLSVYRRGDGRPMEYVAADLKELAAKYPEVVRRYLAAGIRKVGKVEVG